MHRLTSALIVSAAFSFCARCQAEDAHAKAIDLGSQYLKGIHKPEANYSGGSYKIGSATLCGLALLESGVPVSDPAIKNITDFVRAHALRQTKVYEISLTIMYLDRLGDSVDQPAIQFLAVQLMAGQGDGGEWGYASPIELSEAEAARVHKSLYESSLRSVDPTPNAKERPKNVPAEHAKLHPEVARFLRALETAFAKSEISNGTGDHSNTQFAVLALWIARKHNVPCNNALARCEKQFRAVQHRDGAWGYTASDPSGDLTSDPGSPPMTCSGLLALAVGRAIGLQTLRSKSSNPPKGNESAQVNGDRAVLAGLKYIENAIANSERPMAKADGPMQASALRDNLYFLWSVERVAMIYDLEKIGKLDWYKWGSEHLIKTQAADGSWGNGGYQGANGEINTAFALLFLNRANLAKDLTATLKGTAKINLPDRKTDPETIKVDPKQTGPGASDADAEANRLSAELVKATATTRPTLLAKLRDTKGSVYTEALVRAIAKLQGEPQREAREALAMRLKRMTALTLREMLKDENREIRNAAAWACGLKDDKQFVADLIAVLNDTESFVVQSARNSLRSLSGKDFGPQGDANAADKAKAIADWKAWLAAQPK